MLKIGLFLLSLGLIKAQNPPCSVCGVNKEVTIPGANITNVPQSPITCADYEALGAAGEFTAAQCEFVPAVTASVCGCEQISGAPVFSPVAPTAPVATGAPVAEEETDVPATSAPVTSAPVTSAPAAATSSPDTSAPVTSAPVAATSSPVTSAPVAATSSPVTSAPIAPVVFTAAPATPSPVGDEGTEAPASPSCEICPGAALANPDAVLFRFGTRVFTCGTVEALALMGVYTEEVCLDFVESSEICRCEGSPTIAPTPSPTMMTAAPIAPVVPGTGNPVCAVCGAGMEVTDAGAMITSGSPQGALTCAAYRALGISGFLSAAECAEAPTFTGPCGCQAI